MATYYIDHVNGADANAGTSWALAWKSLSNGATAARIAPGDEIRIAKSPAPTSLGQTASWTNKSRTVTLSSAVTSNIYMNGAWTASTNVTCTTNTSAQKEGANCSSIAIAAGFTTGKVAYYALGAPTDFSGYQQISLWIRSSSVPISAGTFTLDLCSDTTGDVPVNTISIPLIPASNYWQAVTVDLGTNLGSSIQSVSLNATTDPGTPTILIDNVIACKASSSADSLTLSSLISKNSAEQGGTESWYGIQSINGTTIILDSGVNTLAAQGRGYFGTTESATVYKRETIKTVPASSTSAAVDSVADSGTLGNNIIFKGGYDTSSGLQSGETFLDGVNGNGSGISISSKNFVTVDRLSVVRYYVGINLSSSSNITLSNIAANNITQYGITGTTGNNIAITNCTTQCSANRGMYFNGCPNILFSNIVSQSNFDSGIYLSDSSPSTITNGILKNNQYYGINANSSGTITSAAFSDNGSGGIQLNGGRYILLNNCTISESTEASFATAYANDRMFSQKHDGTNGNNWIFAEYATINSQSSIRHTASGLAWKMNITNAARGSHYPMEFSIAKVAVTANEQRTIKCWVYKDSDSNLTGGIKLKGLQIAGVDNDIVATAANIATTWEELSLTFTPTEDGVVEILGYGYYSAGTGSIYFDDMSIT